MRLWLKQARELKKLTQQQLGGMVGIDTTTIGKYENATRRPSYEVAKKIAVIPEFEWTLFFEDNENAG